MVNNDVNIETFNQYKAERRIMLSKKAGKKIDEIKEKLDYLGLNIEDAKNQFENYEPLKFRIPKFYDEKQYRQYRYIPIKDIQILLTPTNRLDDVQEKYKNASPIDSLVLKKFVYL